MSNFIDDEPLDKWQRKAFGVKFGGRGKEQSNFAADTYARLTRESWYTYMNELGVPQENQLLRYATDPSVVSNAMSEASQDVNQSFDRMAGITNQRVASLGLTLDADEQAAQTRSTGLARSLADVGAQNRVRDMTRARQQSILGNPAPDIGALKP
jgi:hypothetical protein